MGKIKSIPKKMKFTYPDGSIFEGNIVEEDFEDYDAGDYIYRKFIQFIDFGDDEPCIRFTYYRKPKGRDDNSWVFGGQMSPLLQVYILQKLIKKFIKKKRLKI